MRVNGRVVGRLATQVLPQDTVLWEGQRLQANPFSYLLLNKPKNCLCTKQDPQKRRTVMDLLPKDHAHLFPVGRLDRNTTGLLLLTNDGYLAQQLSHPSHHTEKAYQVVLNRPFASHHLAEAMAGIRSKGERLWFDKVEVLSSPKALSVTLFSGKNRVIRRVCEALGYEVMKLDRRRYAGLEKKGLVSGKWRPLRDAEVRALKQKT